MLGYGHEVSYSPYRPITVFTFRYIITHRFVFVKHCFVYYAVFLIVVLLAVCANIVNQLLYRAYNHGGL